MSKRGEIRVTHTKSGLKRYVLEIRHGGLNKYEVVRGDNLYIVEQKAEAKMAQWDEMWERKQEAERKRLERERRAKEIEEKKLLADERTEEAQQALSALENTLAHTLGVDDTVDWESLKDFSDYPVPRPEKPALPQIPREPQLSDQKYEIKIGFLDDFLDGVFTSRRVAREKERKARFKREHQQWQEAKGKTTATISRLQSEYQAALSTWDAKRAAFLRRRDERNASVDAKMERYLGNDPEAIVDYCDMVLSNSDYPDYFPQSCELDYNPESKILIVDYQLPAVDSIPTLKEVKYVQTRDEFDEKHISQTQLNALYDNLLYQIALRTIHELYEADRINALISVVFNGYVDSIDPATGQEVHACVLSLMADKEEFEAVNLASVEPKACFKKLKGVGSSKLHSMAPVAPILQMDREDSRFIDSYAVIDGVREGDNLAAMDWEDFEHLVRELFEKEFSGPGSEVKVTRASRDGGIDAVVFDPDPIHGGKIVIQAKRYTNAVGVSAVRDLYGTVMNEGANKGILVTTADYGPDAYKFAKDKPLVLLNGSNLLHLLEKHGHKAWIDLKEAKSTLAEDWDK